MNDPVIFSFDQTQITEMDSRYASDGYPAAYRYIYSVIKDSDQVPDEVKYWFLKAAEINSDAPTSSNIFIRTVTAEGFKWNSKAFDDNTIQNNSDTIGLKVLEDIRQNNGISNISGMITNDISAAVEGNQDLGGWGGSFYFWNAVYTPPGQSKTTVGNYIKSDPNLYEEFLASNAIAMITVNQRILSNVSVLTNSQIIQILDEQTTAGWGGLKALPPSVMVDMADRVRYILSGGDAAGNPNSVYGWTLVNNEWLRDLGDFPIYADAAQTQELNMVHDIRLAHQGLTSLIAPIASDVIIPAMMLYGQLNLNMARKDPLLIDLSGDGISLQASSLPVQFDFEGNGKEIGTVWIRNGEGFLVQTGSFGSRGFRIFESFSDLAQLDSDQNTIIDQNDWDYSTLMVWQDNNRNGVVDGGELSSLASVGILSIQLQSTAEVHRIEGGIITGQSTVKFTNGTSGLIAAVDFNTNQMISTFTGLTTHFTPIELKGYGDVPNLSQSNGLALTDAVDTLVRTSSNDTQAYTEALTDVMLKWAQTDTSKTLADQQLEFLQKFFANYQGFTGFGNNTLFLGQTVLVKNSWASVFSGILARVLVQIPQSSLEQAFLIGSTGNLVVPRNDYMFSLGILSRGAPTTFQENLAYWSNALIVLNTSISDQNNLQNMDKESLFTVLRTVVPHVFNDEILHSALNSNLNFILPTHLDQISFGTTASDLIEMQGTDSTYMGYGGNDDFIYHNSEFAIIDEVDNNPLDRNELIMSENISADVVGVTADAQGNIVLSINGTSRIILKGMFWHSPQGIEEGAGHSTISIDANTKFGVQAIRFADGTVWLETDILARAKQTTTLDDKIYGTPGAEQIDGKGGNDYIQGMGGGDTFVYNQGYGFLEINQTDTNPQSTNTLVLGAGITTNDIKVTSTLAGDMIINIFGVDSIRLDGMLSDSSQGIQSVILADNTTITRAELIEMACTGSSTNTSITSLLANQTIDPAGYAHSIHLAGGNSLIRYDLGYGRVEITQHDANPADQNTLLFGAGIDPGNVTVSGDGAGSTVLTVSSGDVVQLNNMVISPSNGVQVIRFADGTAWSAQSIVSQVSGQIQGYFNTYNFTSGMGNITVSAAGISGIAFGAGITMDSLSIRANSAGDVIFNNLNDSLTVIGSISSNAANLFRTETSIHQLSFADGSVISMGSTPNFIHRSDSNNTRLIGINNANNTFYLNPGDTFIKGGTTTQANTEINTIVMNRGIGQVMADLTGGIGVIRMAAGIEQSDIVIQSLDSGDLTVKIASTGDSLLVRNGIYMTPYGPSSLIQSIQFSDGSTMPISLQGFTPTPLTYSWIGVGDGKIMVGSEWGKNTFIVGPNNAQIVAGTGSHYNATGTFNYNTFLYDQGDGNSVIEVNNAVGEIDLAPDVLRDSVIYQTDNAGSLIVKFLGDPNDSITLKNDIYSTPYGLASRISKIVFGDGTHTDLNLTGPNAINFTWIGNSVGSNYGTNIYDLGRNGASVIAGNGSNTVQFDRGDGKAIVDFANTVNSNTSQNTVRMMASIQSKDILFQTSGNDLIVRIKDDPNDILTLKGDIARNFYGPMSTVQSLNFADGTVIPVNFIGSNAISFTWTGSATGSDYGANTFDLHSSLTKTISGGNGSQSGVYPVSNQNTFLFSMGSGQTTVNLRGSNGITSGGGNIVMADGITPDQVLFQANNSGDLTVGLKTDTLSKVTFLSDLVQNWFGVTSAINQIKFSDGTVQNLGVVNYQNNPIQFTWTADTNNTVLKGSNYGLNVFNTAPGNDQITTGSGSNIFNYTRGDGRVDVDISQGTGLLNLKGLSLSDTYFQASDDGSLKVSFHSSPMDSIRFTHDVSSNWWGVASALNSIRSDDGSTMAVGSPYYNQGAPIQSTWLGTDIDQTFTGTHFGLNTFQLASANDTVNSVNNDTVIVGSGNSTVHANGSTINLTISQGSTSLDGSAIATANMAGGNLNYSGVGGLIANVIADSSITVLNGSNDQISTLENTHNYIQLGSGTTTVFSHGNDFIQGGSLGGHDIINGGSGLMTFFGGSNQDTLQIGMGGLDFTLGTAHSEIIEYGSSGASLYRIVESMTGGDAMINNFRPGIDHIGLLGFGTGEIANAISGQNQQGNRVDLSFSNSSHLALTGIGMIGQSDFASV